MIAGLSPWNTSAAMAIDGHYENFPVASWLLPTEMRSTVAAIYRFARHADDLADEGQLADSERLAGLDRLAADLERLWQAPVTADPPQGLHRVVSGLQILRQRHPEASLQPFLDLLSAFRQDVLQKRYPDRQALLDYCARSANPVGRLMLMLFGIEDEQAWRESDAICTSLQLINFWQDAALDAERGRLYVPLDAMQQHEVAIESFPQAGDHAAMMREQCLWALELMHEGMPLLARLSGRLRWEIAFTIAGGVRILQKIALAGFDVKRRPKLGWYDGLLLPRLALLAIKGRADLLRIEA